ncbi:P-loop containing nucleoside triphosphate hydrolase protein [Rhypophila decipiens]|uniref:Peroxisomal ATPase PEX1 n=1 Tax=Rhypophila decipiens TaxID=261697 RepID=A0AAN6YIZ8_9PEZI|nr:P-loop containing nucleoside triphosphate hydrolase protein [Rhypophila decipiens]
MAPRRNAQSTAAEISLVHLQNCLVNLPPSLASLLSNVNTPAQNVIVELNYRAPPTPGSNTTSPSSKSIYVGWTGMSSRRKAAPIVGRDGLLNGSRGSSSSSQEVPLVEIDAKLASAVGLQDGQKVVASIHFDPPITHTVNIEPLTPEDWEMIELHGTFLEDNLLFQIRAVPNPAYVGPSGVANGAHPLTLHLSQTSTANIKVLSLDPPLAPDIPFAKIGPDAEVIVAPKVRSKQRSGNKDNKSVGGTSKKSGKSSASTARRKSSREEKKPALFLRGVDRALCEEFFDEGPVVQDLSVFVDRDLISTGHLKSVNHVSVSLVRPAGLQQPIDSQHQPPPQEGETVTGSTKIVARLRAWDDPPNGQTAALSPALCAALGCTGLVGGVVKIEVAPNHLPRKSADKDGATRDSVQTLKVYPFASTKTAISSGAVGLKFGGQSKAEKEEAAKQVKHIYGADGNGLLLGPLTDGQVLGLHEGLSYPRGWEGAIVKFDPPSSASSGAKKPLSWIMGSDWKLPISVQPPITRPTWLSEFEDELAGPSASGDSLLVGIDSLLSKLQLHLSHLSSVLLTGGQGSGKTSVAQSVARTLRYESFFHTTYFSCTRLVNDESRISTVKETLNRLFMAASWGARLGGKALVVLDDLDKLCPAETELQVGNDNARSRQISEAICAMVKQYCGGGGERNVVLLATCQGKDSLHNVLVGGHVVREIVDLSAPDKDTRRKILEAIVKKDAVLAEESNGLTTSEDEHSRPTTADGSAAPSDSENGWMDGPEPVRRTRPGRKNQANGFVLDQDLDYLDIAGHTDGYMPGDLILLISRARNEALSRAVTEISSKPASAQTSIPTAIPLARHDFTSALKGFTPASLRNVTLQSSTTTFSSIGGLHETRKILLETLEYPTKYAPIFAQCPLRLRSGLLLYGYPGCGKTLLASAVAGECGLNFISVKGPEILNKYIGASEKSVRDLFERASAAKPCVLFFDEFDSIAPKRGHDSTGVTDRVVNQLLTQMDGAEGLSGVYVLAATSRPDLIDPALLRPGRLDKSLLCDFPGGEDRLDILRALMGKVKLVEGMWEDERTVNELQERTEGFSGADLQALVSNAQLEAIHDVLGDHGAVGGSSQGQQGRNRKKGVASGTGREFIQFPYGEKELGGEGAPKTRQAMLAEQAAISAKLEALKTARKRARGGKDDGVNGDSGAAKNAASAGNKEVVIGWKHIFKALEGTRASISAQERSRLERIYREFVVGRSGDMKDGQGSMEVGGRSSLM